MNKREQRLKESAHIRAEVMSGVDIIGGMTLDIIKTKFPDTAEKTLRGILAAMVRNKMLAREGDRYVKNTKEYLPPIKKERRGEKTEVRVEDNRIIIEHPRARVIVELK